MYFDWVRARFDQGKPKAPKLLIYSINTMMKGKNILTDVYLSSFEISENNNPAPAQKEAR